MRNKIFSIILVFTAIFICFFTVNAYASEEVEIKFNDKNLYNAIDAELNSKYTYSKNDTNKTITIEDTEIAKIKKLELDGKDISDISGLDKFTALEELVLNNNKVASLTPLYSLNKLEYLDLAHNCVTSIDGINQMTSVKHLDLYDNIVRNLSGLSNMTGLEYLDLGDNNEVNVGSITNINSLSTLTNLTYFNFSRNNTPEIVNYIKNMTKLQFLNLQGNKITSIDNLSKLTSIKELYLNSNSITDISPIADLSNIEVLNINSNNISSIDSLFEEEELVFAKIKKLYIYKLKVDKKSDKIAYLKDLSKAKKIELGYDIMYDSVEPHTDANGVKYVTYEDFGARCDGVYDDMIAIRDAHRLASSKGYEVRATSGKTYHIFNYYEGTVGIYTSTDWKNATFIIHDENIESTSGRFDNLFTITSNYSGITTLENPNVQIKKSLKKITGLEETLGTLNSKGYKKYMIMAENSNKKISLRYGTSSADNLLDCFEIDFNGNVLNDIQWDFDTVTKITIYPISEKTLELKNAKFITNVLNGVHDVPYGRGYGKPLYFQRGLFFWAASNVDITNINHTLSEDRLSGSYYNFLCFRYCSDINIKDSSFFAREFGTRSRSTYDLKIEQSVNFYFENVTSNGFHDSNRWGVMATQYCKDFVFNKVKLNRIDAHQTIYNLTVKDSYLGYHGFTLTGQGTLRIENTTVESEYFINLRSDYGSTWNGDIYISNCTHKHQSNYMHKFINFSVPLDDDGSVHYFGYELHQPNIYIENFTLDCINKPEIKSYPIIANFKDHNFESAKDDYWPKEIYINGYKIINNNNAALYIAFLATASDKINNNYLMTNTTLKVGSEDYTHKFNMGETFVADENVSLEIVKNISTDNSITIWKDNSKVVDSQKVDDKFTYQFTDNGKYKIKIDSVDTHLGKTGEKLFEFEVSKKEVADPETDEKVLQLEEILDNKYNNLTKNISITSTTKNLNALEVLSGTKKCKFELTGNKDFNDIEVTLKVDSKIAKDLDVLALYEYKNEKWEIFGYYEVLGDKFTFETSKLGKYAIVNKTEGEKKPTPIITDSSKNTNTNFRDKKDKVGIYSSDKDIVLTHWWGTSYANNLEFINTTFKTDETGILNFTDKGTDEICNFYFENCTFDGISFKFANKGHYAFNNCTFINSPEGTIELINENVNIYLYNSTLKDNNPNKEEFNANEHSERAWKYSAIGFRRNNGSAHVVKTKIENYMTNNSVYGATDATGNKLYFEYSSIKNVEGQAIGFYCEMKGRIDNNEFYNIGELRGKNGYAIKYSEEYGGSGVGGNAIFCNKRTREMRIYKNNIKNVMENAIEGHYYCVNDNTIESTGYRYEEGFETVSTEAIWGGSWQVKNNVIKDVHGRGIMVNRWDNVPTEISGNTIIKSGRNATEDYEGIRVNIADSGSENVLVTNNTIIGFVNKYRILNSESKYMMKNVIVNDKGDGKLMGNVYSSLRGLQFTSDRQQKLDFKNAKFESADENGITDWNVSNLKGKFEQKEENGVKYGSFESKDKYGRISQKFDLPKETCIVCLKVTLRSNVDTVNVFVISENDDGVRYESSDGGVYTEYKIPITGVDKEEFKTVYMCFKAKDHSTIGLYVKEPNQVVDVQDIEGYYVVDNFVKDTEEPEHKHTLVKTEAKPATCEEDGNIEYYQCSECRKMFSDAEGTTEIEKQDAIVYAKGHDWGEWNTIKEATVDEEGTKTRVCKNDALHKETETIPRIPYKVLEGENQTIKTQENKELYVRFNGNYSKFVEVKINGTVLDKSNYTVKSGSTIITLKPEYLATLSSGTYTLSVVYTDGEASTNFTVEKSITEPDNQLSNANNNQEKQTENNEKQQESSQTQDATQTVKSINNTDNSSNLDSKTQTGKLPKTGDLGIGIWIALMSISALGMILVIITYPRKSKH